MINIGQRVKILLTFFPVSPGLDKVMLPAVKKKNPYISWLNMIEIYSFSHSNLM